MVINTVVSDSKRAIEVDINGAWITLSENGKTLWKREPRNSDWYDSRHAAIMKALHEFEDKILAAVEIL